MNQLYRLVRYNSINTTLFWLNSRVNLSITVALNKAPRENKQKFCYNEFQTRNGINAYMDLSWWMHLKDIYNAKSDNVDFIIWPHNHYQFLQTVHTMKLLFLQKQDLFLADMEHKIFRPNPNYEPLKTTNQFRQSLVIAPAIKINDIGEPIQGCQIIINDSAEPVFMSTANLLNFDLFLTQLNPTMMAMQMLTFLNSGSVGRESLPVGNTQANTPQAQSTDFLNTRGAKER